MPNRTHKKLTLNCETLRRLGDDHLRSVGGGVTGDFNCNLTLQHCQSGRCATDVYCLSDTGLTSCC